MPPILGRTPWTLQVETCWKQKSSTVPLRGSFMEVLHCLAFSPFSTSSSDPVSPSGRQVAGVGGKPSTTSGGVTGFPPESCRGNLWYPLIRWIISPSDVTFLGAFRTQMPQGPQGCCDCCVGPKNQIWLMFFCHSPPPPPGTANKNLWFKIPA